MTSYHTLLREDIGLVNPRDFGATGDGTTDDTSAIQAAINAAPPNGIVHLPLGRYRISATLNPGAKCITLQGVDARMIGNDVYGNSSWQIPSMVSGSVLIITQTSGVGIANTNIGTETTCIRLRNLVLIGPGTGTTIGIELGHEFRGNAGSILHNVNVANFAIGFKFVACYELTCTHLWSRGCDVGFLVGDAMPVNQAVFINTMIERAHTIGIHIFGGMNQVWSGGLMQSNDHDGFVIESLEASTFEGWHFESPLMTGDDIRIEDALAGNITFRNSRMSTNPTTGGIRVNNGRRVSFDNIKMLNGRVTIAAAAAFTMFCQCSIPLGSVIVTDNSDSTIWLLDSSTTVSRLRIRTPVNWLNMTGINGLSGSGVDAHNLRGTVTFASATTRVVTFAEAEVDANYFIQLTGNASEIFWVTNKTINGFTIHSNVTTSVATVDWLLVR